MSCYISVRDVNFTPSTEGVRIVVITDVPCHLWVRLSLKHPWIHKKPVLRRGVRFADDVRFCFTVFEDNEQFEKGDTLIHTFWKPDWEVCTTKYLYFWGYVAGVKCNSTSALFKYHNDGISPVPTPDFMYQLNSIDPEYHSLFTSPAWTLESLAYDIPPGATGALLALYNIDPGSDNRIAIKKPTASYDHYFEVARNGVAWLLVGLNDAREFHYRVDKVNVFACYVMGYTGRDVVFPDTPIDIKPSVDDTHETFNIKSQWPDAQIIFTDEGSNEGWNSHLSIRPLGSGKEIYGGAFHQWPFCAVPASGEIQTKLKKRDGASTGWVAYAYIREDSSYSLNGVNLGVIPPNTWTNKSIAPLNPNGRWAFIEMDHTLGLAWICTRKALSFYAQYGTNLNHNWAIVHVHDDAVFQLYCSVGSPTWLLLAECH